MKWLILFLVLVGAAGLFAAITGIQEISYSDAGRSVHYHGAVGRFAALCLGVFALVTARACAKRTMFGWYSIAALLWIIFLGEVVYAMHAAFTWDLPVAGIVLGLLGEGVKIGVMAWILFRFWPRQRSTFKNA